jgi:hypothetical protein
VKSTIPAEQKEKFLSTADILRQEGRQEGEILARQQDVVLTPLAPLLILSFGHRGSS